MVSGYNLWGTRHIVNEIPSGPLEEAQCKLLPLLYETRSVSSLNASTLSQCLVHFQIISSWPNDEKASTSSSLSPLPLLLQLLRAGPGKDDLLQVAAR